MEFLEKLAPTFLVCHAIFMGVTQKKERKNLFTANFLAKNKSSKNMKLAKKAKNLIQVFQIIFFLL